MDNKINIFSFSSLIILVFLFSFFHFTYAAPVLRCGEKEFIEVSSIFSDSNTATPPTALEDCIIFYLHRVLTWLYTISLGIAVIMLVYAGFLYTAKPEESKSTHKILIYAIIGVTITVLSYIGVKAIEYTLITP